MSILSTINSIRNKFYPGTTSALAEQERKRTESRNQAANVNLALQKKLNPNYSPFPASAVPQAAPVAPKPPVQAPVPQQQTQFSQQSPAPQNNAYSSQVAAIQSNLEGLMSRFQNSQTQQQSVADPYAELRRSRDAIMQAQKPTDEEDKTEQTLQDLLTSRDLGIESRSGRGVPMPFVAGQQAAIERRASIQATPLSARLSQLQAKRASALDAAKTMYDTEKDISTQKAKDKEAANKTTEVGGNLVKLNPQTGKYETVYASPKTSEAKAPTTMDTAQGIMQWNPGTGSWESTGFSKPKTKSEASEKDELEKSDKEKAAQQQTSQALQAVNDLISGDRYKSISGPTQTGSIPFFGDRQAVGVYDQLQGILKLGARQLLKGQGQISDYEGKVLASAASSLTRLTSESQMRDALLKVRGVLRTNSGQETEVSVTNINTGEVIPSVMVSGEEVYRLVSEGNDVKYL